VNIMINPSDFAPLIARAALAPATPSARGTASSPSSWFDPAAVSADTRISADLNPASRGLGVDQHAAQVLSHLCGEREDGA
jgi:hypothetical protein